MNYTLNMTEFVFKMVDFVVYGAQGLGYFSWDGHVCIKIDEFWSKNDGFCL